MSEHTHVGVNNTEIRHDHENDLGEEVAHFHSELSPTTPLGFWKKYTSVYYPDIDGKPDPRDMCRTEHVALAASERLRDDTEARVAELEAGIKAAVNLIHWSDPDRGADLLERLLERGEE